MTRRLKRAIGELGANPVPAAHEVIEEAMAFLRWLDADNFIFLGAREYDYTGGQDTGQLEPKPESGLGLLRDESLLRSRARPGPARAHTSNPHLLP